MPGLTSRPATPALGLAAGLLAALGVLAIGYAALLVAATVPERRMLALGVSLLLAGYGAFLLGAASGVWRGRRWSRGPAMAMSLLQVPLAWSIAGAQTWWIALILGAVSVTVLACLLLKSSTAVFVPNAPDQP